MGKMSELAAELSELKRCGEVLISLSESITALLSAEETPPPEPKPAKRKKADEPPEPKPLTLEEVRAVLAEKSRSGHTAEVKALLTKYGADKLSALDPSKYAELLSEVEVLGNAE